MTVQQTYIGGCHCGQVAFEAAGPIENATVCNCSICSKKSYLHWIIPRDRFRLLTDWNALATYTFNTGVAKHHFCPRCGVESFYIPRSDPDKIDVNLRCVEGIDLDRIEITRFDGQDWENAIENRR